VTKPISTEKGVTLVVVNSKELYKREDTVSLKQSEEALRPTRCARSFQGLVRQLRSAAGMKVAVK